MDRCALFVDAGYVLADGAMAVHGTRHRESVSWDYAGLLSFMGSIARERTGRPLLRCYWYEATVEGRRTSEHDSLADLPGLKLRLGRTRPGRREGVEGEIRRDLTTLARNNAISDALLVSAEEDLAQVVADVQDLGIRVTIVHITVGGNWTISRSLRQECDDIIEIGEGHLRPFTQLVAGTDALGSEEPYQLAVSAARALTNGHGPVVGPLAQQALSAGSHPAPPAIYTAPVVAEYQRAAQPGAQPATAQLPDTQLPDTQLPGQQDPAGQPSPLPRRQPPGPAERPPMEAPRGGPSRAPGSAQEGAPPQSAQGLPAASGLQAQPGVSDPQRTPGPGQRQPGGPAQPGQAGQQAIPGQPIPGQSMSGQSMSGRQNMGGQQGTPGQAMPPQSYAPPSLPPQGPPAQGMPAQGMPAQGPAAQQNGSGHQSMPGQSVPGQSIPGQHAAPPAPPAPSSPGLPDPRARGAHAQPPAAGQNPYQAPPASFRGPAQDVPSRPYQQGPYGALPSEQMMPGQPYGQHVPPALAGPGQSPGGAYVPPQSPYGTPQSPLPPQTPVPQTPVPQAPVPQPPASPPPVPPPASGPHDPASPDQGLPLADAVQAAHAEGFEFGQSVAREAPALWLEAVLARKPRMPSDLEARLLQDSALPIDSLLHDETRHALRRGFWDALERSRR